MRNYLAVWLVLTVPSVAVAEMKVVPLDPDAVCWGAVYCLVPLIVSVAALALIVVIRRFGVRRRDNSE
jgi:hypothetical protein